MTTPHVKETAQHARDSLDLRDPFWPAQLTVALAIAIQVFLPEKLTLGPAWLLPAAEGVLLLGLMIATPHPDIKHSPFLPQTPLALTRLVSPFNLFSLPLL